jgi:hypothetical protein
MASGAIANNWMPDEDYKVTVQYSEPVQGLITASSGSLPPSCNTTKTEKGIRWNECGIKTGNAVIINK